MIQDITHIVASGSDVWIGKPEKGGTPLPGLKPGQVVSATVEKMITPRHAHLIIQGRLVSARTYVPLRSGQTVLLRAETVDGNPRLKILDAIPREGIIMPREILTRSNPYDILTRMIKDLHTAPGDLRSLSLKPLARLMQMLGLTARGIDAGAIKTWIDGSGLVWEHKLATAIQAPGGVVAADLKGLIQGDLKGLAMALADTVKQHSAPGADTLGSFVENLENLQILNSRGFRETGRYLLPIPLLTGESFRFGQMLVDLGKSDSENRETKDRMVRVAFRLVMSDLGDVQADFSFLKDAVSGSFGVGHPDIQRRFQEDLPGLIKRLRENGFSVSGISCVVLDPQQLTDSSFLEQIIPTDTGVLNIVI
jgi:hypothetical protein